MRGPMRKTLTPDPFSLPQQQEIREILRALMFGLLLALTPTQGAFAQTKNVQDAITVIVLFCVAGGDRVEISNTGKGDGEIQLKSGGGANSPGITISTKTAARGLVDGILREMSQVSAAQASEARKCMQPYIERIINTLLGQPNAATTSLPQKSSWTHNGSIMSVTTQEDRIMIYYQQPRQGMIDEGVRPGTLLFDGRRTGNRLSGTSYVFDRRCGRIPYSDDGNVLSGERSIFLSGRRVPTQLSADCAVVAYRVDPSIIDRRD